MERLGTPIIFYVFLYKVPNLSVMHMRLLEINDSYEYGKTSRFHWYLKDKKGIALKLWVALLMTK